MEIRRIELQDITNEQFSEIVEIEKNSGLEPFSAEMLAADIAYQDEWAAFDGERVLGFITVSEDEGYFPNSLFIININVGEKWRRKGLAAEMIRTALRSYPDVETMSLDVSPDNEKAFRLYTKLGFRKTDTESCNHNGDIVMIADRNDVLSFPLRKELGQVQENRARNENDRGK